jgi:hypothetical protein
MATKDADIRINETIKLILTEFPVHGRELKDAIQHRLMSGFAAGPARAALSASIAIGGWHFNDGARRKLERIYLLAERTVGGKTAAEAALLRAAADAMTVAQLRGLIQGIADGVGAAPPPGAVQLAESFNYALAGYDAKAQAAVLKAKRVIAHMYQGVRAANADVVERARFERWFGPMNAARYLKVCNNIAAVYTDITTRPLKLYYRGLGCDRQPNDKPGPAYHRPAVNLISELEYGCFVPGFGAAEPDRTHVLLGTFFFTRCQDVTHATDVHAMSGFGVIVHELLHAVCNADDERDAGGQVLYYPKRCKAAALAEPDKTVNNADSYRLFADEYDTAAA